MDVLRDIPIITNFQKNNSNLFLKWVVKMCKILLSINPMHVENIFNGTKKYEYRKVKCREYVEKILIYSTSPVMKVVGEASVQEILQDTPEIIWKKTKKKSGIDKEFFQSYYSGKSTAIAYKLTDIKVYKHPKDLSFYGLSAAPQSFVYISE